MYLPKTSADKCTWRLSHTEFISAPKTARAYNMISRIRSNCIWIDKKPMDKLHSVKKKSVGKNELNSEAYISNIF